MVDSDSSIIFDYNQVPTQWLYWPPWALYRGIAAISDASSSKTRSPYSFQTLTSNDFLADVYVALFVESIIIFCLIM